MLSISACLIVKNESRNLYQCLNSIAKWVDEIIVVDTGSTDNTIAIASQFTAQIYTFDWCDNYSAARNVALEKATQDWILILNGDETLAAESGPLLLPTLKQQTKEPVVLMFRLLTPGAPTQYVRGLFPNHLGIRFKGRVHEWPHLEHGQLQAIECPNLIVHHRPVYPNHKYTYDKTLILQDLKELTHPSRMIDSENLEMIDSSEFIKKVRQDPSYVDEFLREDVNLKDPNRAYHTALDLDLYDVAAAVISSSLPKDQYKYALHNSVLSEIEYYYYLDGHQFIEQPEINWTQVLIQSGVNLNPLNEKRQTPLDVATSKRHPHPLAIELLKTAGAKHAHELTLEEQLLESDFYVICRIFEIYDIQKCLNIRFHTPQELSPREVEAGIDYALAFSEKTLIPPYRYEALAHLLYEKFPVHLNPSGLISKRLVHFHRNPHLLPQKIKGQDLILNLCNYLQEKKADPNCLYLNKTLLDRLSTDSRLNTIPNLEPMIREWGGKTMEELKAEGRVRLIDPPPDCFGSPINTWELIPE